MTPASPRGASWPPRPVLVVEDDDALREVLSEILTEEGFLVRTAADGLEALEQLRGQLRPCAVLLDWLMPRLDGPGLLQRLEEQGALNGLTIVVTTQHPGPISHERVAHVLRKPYDIEDLLPLLDRYCGPGMA